MAAIKTTYEHLSATTTLVLMKRDLLTCKHMRNEPPRQLDTY
jgi:hypothetical protein